MFICCFLHTKTECCFSTLFYFFYCADTEAASLLCSEEQWDDRLFILQMKVCFPQTLIPHFHSQFIGSHWSKLNCDHWTNAYKHLKQIWGFPDTSLDSNAVQNHNDSSVKTRSVDKNAPELCITSRLWKASTWSVCLYFSVGLLHHTWRHPPWWVSWCWACAVMDAGCREENGWLEKSKIERKITRKGKIRVGRDKKWKKLVTL